MKFETLYREHAFSFYFKAISFAQASFRLKEIGKTGKEIFEEESAKLNIAPGEVKVIRQTNALKLAKLDMDCTNIGLYLLAHSMELLIKALYLKAFEEIEYQHTISRLFGKIKEKYNFSDFNKEELDELFLKLDEVLIWAGRYPTPKLNLKNEKKKNALKKKVMNFSEVSIPMNGIDIKAPTTDISLIIRTIGNGKGLNLLEDIHQCLLAYASEFFPPINLEDYSATDDE